MAKWVAGILATVIGGVLVFWLTEAFRNEIKPNVEPEKLEIIVKTSPASSIVDKKDDRYQDSSTGLRNLIEDIIDGIEREKPHQYSPLIHGLFYEGYDSWFRIVFGNEYGREISQAYEKQIRNSAHFYSELFALFRSETRKGRTVVKIRRFVGPSDEATGNQNKVMDKMIRPVAIYSVRLVEPGQSLGNHIYNFVYIDGGFRLMGKMRTLD